MVLSWVNIVVGSPDTLAVAMAIATNSNEQSDCSTQQCNKCTSITSCQVMDGAAHGILCDTSIHIYITKCACCMNFGQLVQPAISTYMMIYT